ncbi:C-type lectin domain family 2 member D-like isoform X2 [Eublepharis macularius]|uniref:C-type lectin domain family 2 member D-like isoform X2 n=1 Tax=Eublepharis macularius TaxID=481883 RepID=A0AA97J8A4_EUBMA|nr:C-type lectin domain family 2 member D-like isoform X2 [Eublepharis macularius]
MIEERCLQVERLEEPEERTNAEFRGLQEDITEVTEIPEEAKCRNYQSRCLLKSRIARGLTVAIAVLLLIVLVLFGLLVYRPPNKESQQQFPDVDIPAPCGPACPSGWIGYKRKCYFFSDEGRNWTSSQNFCASYGSSLAIIENEPEKVRTTNTYGRRLSRPENDGCCGILMEGGVTVSLWLPPLAFHTLRNSYRMTQLNPTPPE